MNDELALCPPLVRLAFIGLWCAADAQGRMEDRPVRLKAEILPHDEIDFDGALAELAEHDFIRRYEAGGKKLIQVTTFLVHQRISVKEAAQGSQYPPPPEGWRPPEKKPRGRAPRTPGLKAYESDKERHGGEHADVNAGGDKGTAQAARERDFAEEIYQAYPKRVGKPAAKLKIKKALAEVPFERLLELTIAYAQAVNGQDPQFVPHPATWFNQARYNDDPSTWTRKEAAGLQDPRRFNPNAQLAGAETDPYAAIGAAIGAGDPEPAPDTSEPPPE